ncbi:MAG: CPBP family intramembrane metalloprotease [Oscillospiraceae bacterium]|nr:CPBP family intramembrane metalloprotease [Oscillospiraceae bacterium]
MKTANQQNRNRVLIYLGITFGLTWGYCFFILYPLINGETLNGIPAVATQLLVAAAMFFPAIGVLLTRLITKEGFQDVWLKLNLKKNVRYYLLAWFGPGVLTVLGSGLYFLLVKGSFDPNCGYMQVILDTAGAPAGAIPFPLNTLLLIQLVQAFLLAPVMNFITCFGEEWGWRGYLLPKMENRLGTVPLLLVTGVIWGIWHAPLTAIGHNYGMGYAGFPFTGIAMMCLFCIVMGIFLSFVSLKTRSCIPAILGHGAINGIGAIGIYFTQDGGDPFVGPAPTGIIGMIPFMIVAICMVIALLRDKKTPLS